MSTKRAADRALTAAAAGAIGGSLLGSMDVVCLFVLSAVDLQALELLRLLTISALSTGLLGAAAGLLFGWLPRSAFPVVPVLAFAMTTGSAMADFFLLPRLYPPLHLALSMVSLVGAALAAQGLRARLKKPLSLVALSSVALTPLIVGPLLGDGLALRQVTLEHLHVSGRSAALFMPDPTSSWPQDPAPACAFPEPVLSTRRPALGPRNLLLLTVDALRFDEDLPQTFTRLEGATVFSRVYAATPATNESLYALFTGRAPHRLAFSNVGLGADGRLVELGPESSRWGGRPRAPMNDRSTTLAQHFATAGWQTVAVVGDVFFLPEGGLVRGFETIDESPYRGRDKGSPGSNSEAMGETLVAALGKLDAARPSFVWAHFTDPRAPYVPFGELTPEDPSRALYRGELQRVDIQLARVIDALGARRDETVIVVAGDHGEEFREHGGEYHSSSLYEEQVRTQVRIFVPRTRGTTLAGPVSLLDLNPTLLDLFGLETPSGLDGQSLRGPHDEPFSTPDARAILLSSTQHRLISALVYGHLKLVVDETSGTRAETSGTRAETSGTRSLFDLEVDPGERRNLIDERSDEAGRLTCLLRAAFSRGSLPAN